MHKWVHHWVRLPVPATGSADIIYESKTLPGSISGSINPKTNQPMNAEDVKKGTPVFYHPVITQDGKKMFTKKSQIISSPWKTVSGHILCKIKGVSGGVSIKHLELRHK